MRKREVQRVCIAFTLLGLLSAPSFGQDLSGDTAGITGTRDNTRLQGTAFDSSGSPITEVEIWVSNDAAPADRLRAKTRKTGTYLVRGLGQIYSREDVEGIMLRVMFEKSGHRNVQVVIGVEKNGLARVFPILYRDDETPHISGVTTLLTGKVTDSKGKPVKGAQVSIRTRGDDAADDATPVVATTAKNGEYEALLWQAPGKVQVTVSSAAGEKTASAELQAQTDPGFFLSQVLDLAYP